MWILAVLISLSGLLCLTTPLRHLRDFPQRPEKPALTVKGTRAGA
jgi:hypothetical protein